MRNRLLLAIAFLCFSSTMQAAEILHVYGPGGPAPAMKEAAAAFQQKTGIQVLLDTGPTEKWIKQAKSNADLVFSGAEYMMSDFLKQMPGMIDRKSVYPLFLRPSAILVRPGNPKKIKGIDDLLKPGMKILVVDGAGQQGLWEDVAGRMGDIKTVRAFRNNIVEFAPNSAAAKETWQKEPAIDAWLIWNIWQKANPKLAQLVAMDKRYVIYRDVGIALSTRSVSREAAQQFYNFLKTRAAAQYFNKYGWITHKTWE